MTDSTPATAAGIPWEGTDCTPEEAVEAVRAVRASRAELRAAAEERAFWLRTLRDLVTYHGERPWSESDYATAADVLMLAAKASNV